MFLSYLMVLVPMHSSYITDPAAPLILNTSVPSIVIPSLGSTISATSVDSASLVPLSSSGDYGKSVVLA